MAEKDTSRSDVDRIRFAGDVEAGRQVRRPSLRRGSLRSEPVLANLSRRSSIEITAALPIQYRTVSLDIDDYKRKGQAAQAVNSATAELAHFEWHTLRPLDIFQRLSTSVDQGLSVEQASRRLSQYGPNKPTRAPTQYTQKILGYFFGGFGTVLLVASILVFVAWKPLGDPPAIANLALAIVLLVVFFIQAGFNMWQDWSSSRVMASITNMLPEHCQVLRDGSEVTLLAQELVPGDVVLVKAGNKLPADLRFTKVSSDAKFDRSVLTGESVPLPGTVDATDKNYLESRNIGLQGTHCVSGICISVVVGTGDKTVFGRIAQLTNEPKKGMSTLEREIFNFVAIICSIMAAMIILVIIVWATFLRPNHPDWITVPNLIISCVSIAVAFIPEGLPVALTASMTICANLMRKNKILCKSLKTVETLGSVSVICSDKTGTLTQNKMVVTECAVGNMAMTSEQARDNLVLWSHNQPDNNSMEQLRVLGSLCNDGHFDAGSSSRPLHERTIHGDATDQAILRFAESLGTVSEVRSSWIPLYELAFNSKNKFMIKAFTSRHPDGPSTAFPSGEGKDFQSADVLLTIKGAPDVLLGRISSLVDTFGAVTDFDSHAREMTENIKNKWSSQGRRVLLLARKIVRADKLRSGISATALEDEMLHQAKDGLVLVGLVSIVDPPRPEIPSVVETLRTAGVRIWMVTGDFALTAQAIAKECGIVTASTVDTVDILDRFLSKGANAGFDEIVTAREAIVITGPELISLNVEQWDQLCSYQEVVFARTTPEHKLRIVRELQLRREIVGMTGDGVNDAPSLRAADVGIAIGSGSDIAIEAADMVLLDSFSSVVEALRYGRMMFDNLKKTVAYLLPAGSFAEFWPVLTNVCFGVPQILSSFLMIIICLFTDAVAAIALAYETPEADVLSRRPRVPGKDRLVDWQLVLQAYGVTGVLETVASFAMSYWYLERNGYPFSTIWFSFGDLPDFDQDDYAQKLSVASSIYFVNLVVMQWFNLLAVRTRRLSLFQHPPLFDKQTRNLWLVPAILFAFAIALFWLYIPEFQKVLDTAEVPVEHWFLPMAFGLGLLFLDEARKYVVRRYPTSLLARIAW